MATSVLPLVAEVGTELCRVKLEGGSLGGYRCDILTENLSQRELNTYKCSRCKGVMKDCAISNTGEQLCVCCFSEGEQSLCNATIRSTIVSLSCSCPLSMRGCDWLGKLESVENHLTTCGSVHVSCELICEVVTTRDEMERHVREACLQRQEECLHCSGMHKVCEMEEHVKVCGKVAVMCELGCGTRVCRENSLCHIEIECSEETVVCPYENYRCEVVGLKRRELKQHLEDSRIVHLELKLNVIEEENRLEHKIFEEKNVSLKKKIEILESKLEIKEKEIEILKEFHFREKKAVKWRIQDILKYFKPNQGYDYQTRSQLFVVGGYRFRFDHISDALNFNITFFLLIGDNKNLENPLKAIFITRVVCHEDTEQHLIMKSPIIEFHKGDYSKQICSIPLSTDLKNFINSNNLDLEVTLRLPNSE